MHRIHNGYNTSCYADHHFTIILQFDLLWFEIPVLELVGVSLFTDQRFRTFHISPITEIHECNIRIVIHSAHIQCSYFLLTIMLLACRRHRLFNNNRALYVLSFTIVICSVVVRIRIINLAYRC